MAAHWNENIARLLDLKPDGEDNANLPSAMENFLKAWKNNPPTSTAVSDAVAEIAAAMNWNTAEAQRAYAAFQKEAKDESRNDAKPGFTGSREHLLFGLLVGQVLGIPTVFAAMLSPTGGMVGPGPFSFHVKGGVLGYHGIAHDAGGYLCRKHKKDPGYEYILDLGQRPCEKDPLKGQITGIAFWYELLDRGWHNFLATSDASTLSSSAMQDIDSFLKTDPASVPELTSSAQDASDGITLNPAELHFLRALIARESGPTDADMVNQGLESLKRRGLVTGNEQEGYDINDQLIMAAAVAMQPQRMLEASASPAAAASSASATGAATGEKAQAFRYYKWGSYIVEQTFPAPNQMRLAGLRDAGHAQQRLQKILPLSESDLNVVSRTLSENELGTASASTEPVGDLVVTLDSGQVAGTIRFQQFN